MPTRSWAVARKRKISRTQRFRRQRRRSVMLLAQDRVLELSWSMMDHCSQMKEEILTRKIKNFKTWPKTERFPPKRLSLLRFWWISLLPTVRRNHGQFSIKRPIPSSLAKQKGKEESAPVWQKSWRVMSFANSWSDLEYQMTHCWRCRQLLLTWMELRQSSSLETHSQYDSYCTGWCFQVAMTQHIALQSILEASSNSKLMKRKRRRRPNYSSKEGNSWGKEILRMR